MPRTKQTVRVAAPPTRQEVARALVVAAVDFTHTRAQPLPALSPNRCRFLCDWLLTATGADVFATPVQWEQAGLHDYPSFVPYPMDIGTSRSFIVDAGFDFGAFLDRSRLVWANACRYNAQGHPVHDLARRLARVFDEKVIEMQKSAVDDDSFRLTGVYGPLLCALVDRHEAALFVPPVCLTAEPDYGHHVSVPCCLSGIQQLLNDAAYCHRDDVEADLRRVWSNAVAYCGPGHCLTAVAMELGALCDRLLLCRRGDADVPFVVKNAHRMQLFQNVDALTEESLLLVMQKVQALNPDAVLDLGDGTSTFCIDSLSVKQFVAIDTLARKHVVGDSESASAP